MKKPMPAGDVDARNSPDPNICARCGSSPSTLGLCVKCEKETAFYKEEAPSAADIDAACKGDAQAMANCINAQRSPDNQVTSVISALDGKETPVEPLYEPGVIKKGSTVRIKGDSCWAGKLGVVSSRVGDGVDPATITGYWWVFMPVPGGRPMPQMFTVDELEEVGVAAISGHEMPAYMDAEAMANGPDFDGNAMSSLPPNPSPTVAVAITRYNHAHQILLPITAAVYAMHDISVLARHVSENSERMNPGLRVDEVIIVPVLNSWTRPEKTDNLNEGVVTMDDARPDESVGA